MTGEQITKLDRLWSQKVLEDSKCFLCGKPADDPHHFRTKKHGFSVRWYIPNGIPLCRQHHNAHVYSAHLKPDWFNTQVKAMKGQEYIDEMEHQSNKIFKGTYEEVLDHLEGKINNYL